jgi:hypothetical protein
MYDDNSVTAKEYFAAFKSFIDLCLGDDTNPDTNHQ